MLKLGIPSVCCDIIGITALSVNSYLSNINVILPIKADTNNNYIIEADFDAPISNTDPNRTDFSNNSYKNNSIELFLTVISKPTNNKYDNFVLDNEIRTPKVVFTNVYSFGESPNTDVLANRLNQYLVPLVNITPISSDLNNRYDTNISLIFVIQTRPNVFNKYNTLASLGIISANQNNNYDVDILYNVFRSNFNNIYDGLFNNKEIFNDITNNEYLVDTFNIIEADLNNNYDIIGDPLIPFRSTILSNNEYDNLASVIVPTSNTLSDRDNLYDFTAIISEIISASSNNNYITQIDKTVNISSVINNEYLTELQLPFFVLTLDAIAENKYIVQLLPEDKPKCPVPCGIAISITKIQFIQLNQKTAEDII